MLLLDCTDCYTKVEFSKNTLQTSFEDIENVLTAQRDTIKCFMVDDYMFEFIEYTKEGESGDLVHWIIGRYITPIPHLTFMSEEEIWFKMTESSVDKFTFFMEDEMIVSMHGMLFYGGEFKENLIHRFNINEIRNLSDGLVDYIIDHYNEDKKPMNIWNAFKCIGIYANFDEEGI